MQNYPYRNHNYNYNYNYSYNQPDPSLFYAASRCEPGDSRPDEDSPVETIIVD